MPALLPLLVASLKKGLQSARVHHELNQTEEDDEAVTHVLGWQEVYACLLLLEKLALVVASQVR